MRLPLLWLTLALIVALTRPVLAEERFALLMGNDTYNPQGHFGPLPNVKRDLAKIYDALVKVHFPADHIRLVPKANAIQMRAEVRQFANKLKAYGGNAVGFFYYAGHGVGVNNVDYLIPADATIGSRATAVALGVAVPDLLNDIEHAGNRLNIVVLDACRSDPFDMAGNAPTSMTLFTPDAKGTLVAFATTEHATAEDGLYATKLAQAMLRPGRRVDDVFRDARDLVQQERPEQDPDTRDRLSGDPWYFVPQDQPPPPGPAPEQPVELKECATCPEMVRIPAGSFTMGVPETESVREGTVDWDKDARPLHTVRIGQAFYLGRYLVTRGEYRAFATASGRKMEDPGYPQDDRHPVVMVSWDDAQAYVAWLSQRTGKPYRLPSESEWEYAARAGTTTARYWGDSAAQQCQYAKGADQTTKSGDPTWQKSRTSWAVAADCRSGFVHTAPVGSFRPNRFGLYDMLGNASEWMQDCDGVGVDYVGAPADGSAQNVSECEYPEVRGGDWWNIPNEIRVGRRDQQENNPYDSVGLRVARALVP